MTCATFNMKKAYTHISVFYFSAISRDIDLKFVHDTYTVVINSPTNWPLYVKGQCHRDGTLLFEGTVISQKLERQFLLNIFMGTSWVALSIKNIKTRASREMTSRKNIQIFDFNGVNVAKHWHVTGRGICHLWLPCYYCSALHVCIYEEYILSVHHSGPCW